MANLYKPRYTRTDPETGEQIAKRVRKWYCRYNDADGVRQQVALCEDKQAAQAMLTEILRQVDRTRAGIIDPLEKHLSTTVSDHITDYNSHLSTKGRSKEHKSEVNRLIKNLVDECRLRLLSELQAADDQIEHYIAKRLDSGVSHRTVNADIAAIRAFCRWLVRRSRMLRNPTMALEPLNPEEDRRLRRRAMNDEESDRLITTTYTSANVFRRLSGEDRAMLYLLSLRTGLRRRELRTLTPNAFDFTQTPVVVSVQAENSKHRHMDHLPLPEDVSQAFQQYLTEKPVDTPIWPSSWWRQSAKMIRQDLEDAGIQIKDGQGRVLDFHSQRTTFITNLSRAGLPPALAQKLARHSDLKLTMGTYTQLEMRELGTAVNKLRRLSPLQEYPASQNQASESELQKKKILDSWQDLPSEIRQEIFNRVSEALETEAPV